MQRRGFEVGARRGSNLKEKLSLSIYAVAMGLAFVQPWIAIALYIAVALLWFVPDQHMKRSSKRPTRLGAVCC